MKNKIKFSALAFSIASALSMVSTAQAAPEHDKAVIGYLTQWEAWKGPESGFTVKGEATHLNLDLDIYNIVNFSFFGLAKDGSLHSGDYRAKDIYKPEVDQASMPILHNDVYSSWDLHILWGELELLWEFPGNEAWQADKLERVTAQGFVKDGDGWLHTATGLKGDFKAQPLPLKKEGGAKGLIDLANEKGVKVMASLGGWSMSKHFPEVAANPELKERFLQDVDRLMALGFHGIDVDWEFPGQTGMNFTGSPEDYPNFAQLMDDIRERIGPNKLLTAAFKADQRALEGFDWERLNKSMDYFNMMTYDLNGGWSEITGHNSPLFPYPEEEFKELTLEDLRQWMVDENNIPSEKITFGAAFYGRGVQTSVDTAYLGAPTDKRDVTMSVDGPVSNAVDLDNWAMFEGQPNYNFIMKQSGWEHFWDENARVPYAVKGKYFLSYDDERAVREKADYIVENNLGGIIVWQAHGDIMCEGDIVAHGSFLKECTNLRSPLAEQIHESFSQNITPNAAPVLTAPSTQVVASGEVVTFEVSAKDADGDALSFSADNALIEELGNGNAKVTYKAPVTGADITETVVVRVTDGRKTDSATVSIKITGNGEIENTAPVLTVPSLIEVIGGETATISVSATDAENNSLTFSASQGTVAQNGNTAVISLPTDKVEEDTQITVKVTVTDGELSATSVVTVKVNADEETGQPGDTWDASKIYNNGDKVIHNGIEYTAQWWTQGDEPGTNSVWVEKDDGSVRDWNADKEYKTGDKALFKGDTYSAKWWTKGDQPDLGGPWEKQ